MEASAHSFLVSGNARARLVRELANVVRGISDPGGAIVFLSGDFADQIESLAEEIAPSLDGTPALLATAAGVLSEAGQLEAQTGASGVIWRGKTCPVFCAGQDEPEACLSAVTGQLYDHASRQDLSSLVFVDPTLSDAIPNLRRDGRGRRIFGAGVPNPDGVATIDPEGRVVVGSAAAMVLAGAYPPKVRAAPACRLLDKPEAITLARGPLILEVGGQPALDYLGRVAESIEDSSLVLAAVFESQGADPDQFSVQPIRGVDPSRGAVVLPEALPEGAALSFAVRDAVTAREELTRSAYTVKRELAGALPRFGLLLSCAGRGAGLYGTDDAEIAILRRAFPKLPIAGMMSAFELSPGPEGPTLALYTAVMALFATPS